MNYNKELLQLFPKKRMKPIDGMAVTAEVWEEAHEYHRNLLRYHTLFNHGAGIITGLEVIARDPADSMVFILPGIATDSVGRTIVLPEPFAYDFGQREGLHYLLLTHQEGRPQSGNGREDAPLYVHAGYGLEAVSKPVSTPHVELARVKRSGAAGAVRDADTPNLPLENEIDLRYRQAIGARTSTPLSIGVLAGDDLEASTFRGVDMLTHALRRHSSRSFCADLEVHLTERLEAYALLCCAPIDLHQWISTHWGRDGTKVLYEYWQNGGTLFIEPAANDLEKEPGLLESAVEQLSGYWGINLASIERNHPLLISPHLFAEPPVGAKRTNGGVWVGDGLIVSANGYRHLWMGERQHSVATREEIRTAMEWGENIVAYAAERQNSWEFAS